MQIEIPLYKTTAYKHHNQLNEELFFVKVD